MDNKNIAENNLGEIISNARKKKNISQELLANKLNVSRQSVSNWETNKVLPDVESLNKLCDYLEIDKYEFQNKEIIKLDILENNIIICSSFIISLSIYIILFIIVKKYIFYSLTYNNYLLDMPIIYLIIIFIITLIVSLLSFKLSKNTLKKTIKELLEDK